MPPLWLARSACAAPGPAPDAATQAATASTATASAATGEEPASDPLPDEGPRCPLALEIRARLGDPQENALMKEGLTPRIEALLEERAAPMHEDASERLVVIVALHPEDPSTHRVELRLAHERPPAVEMFAESRCRLCGSAELVETIDVRLDEVLGNARRCPVEASLPSGTHLEASHESGEAATATPPRPGPAQAGGRSPRASRLDPLGIAGAVSLGSGLTAVAVGTGLWARGAVMHPRREGWQLNLARPGVALVAVGSTAAVVGAVLLTVDARKRRRASVAVEPLATSERVGVVVRGRF